MTDGQTDRQTDGQTEISVLTGAWSQLKMENQFSDIRQLISDIWKSFSDIKIFFIRNWFLISEIVFDTRNYFLIWFQKIGIKSYLTFHIWQLECMQNGRTWAFSITICFTMHHLTKFQANEWNPCRVRTARINEKINEKQWQKVGLDQLMTILCVCQCHQMNKCSIHESCLIIIIIGQ